MTTSSENNVSANERLSYSDAIAKIQGGFVAARPHWVDAGAYIFQAVSGNFVAFDKSSGRLEPFAVAYMKGLYAPYFPSPEDREATDWLAITRQQADHMGD